MPDETTLPMVRGFILQPTYRIDSGRPIVHLYGKLESGDAFLVRDDRAVPYFFIGTRDRERAWELGARPLLATGKRSLRGEPVSLVEVKNPLDAPPLRDRLLASGIASYEADVRFPMRYLIDHGIRGAMEIHGPAEKDAALGQVFERPTLLPAAFSPQLTVLSFDIETDPKATRLLAISMYGCGAAEVLLFTPPGYSCPEGAIACATEAELLRRFQQRCASSIPMC